MNDVIIAEYRRCPFVLYGAGGVGMEVAETLLRRGCQVQGFIDRTGGSGVERMGMPVHCIEDAPAAWRGCVVALTMFNRDVHEPEIVRKLQTAGFAHVITFLDLHHALGGALSPRFWLGPRAWVESMRPRWERARGRWADARSVAVFDALMAMRLEGRYEAAAEAAATTEQYWPADVPGWRMQTPLRMIDGGAFDGDTIRSLEAAGVVISGIAAFEPDPGNYRALVNRHGPDHQRYPAGMLLAPCGLGETAGQVRFSADQGEASRVSDAGGAMIQCVAIDEFIGGQDFDLVKLDVEGAEVPALRGMREMIIRCRPRLAVSVYHRPGDLWDIPDIIDEIAPFGYHCHLRAHYSFGFDTICYALPK